ncbi:hypothetical protein SARC_13192 [Sphaeroforma arctica JP610]|uniref:MYND-type domain-containing protein n=1 Tax=Sphaeroforma arctica JP610 TaxID=667725 RepID=A0A0L0FBX3_9EUKA|nr:hypothetical protein SARC_13192 [Sphaeroforma arctica JP610]KNC74255.1 hypothetical protein SARC_13192 [Sphaeroforma arctica JP610]|eukprot:XP_014148157.1 hypothetical protein SARC_13192 [Sphaeroforma arctica JP610]
MEMLNSLSSLYDEHGCPMLVLMKYDDVAECILFEVVAVRRRENGEPILQVNWGKHTKSSSNLDAVFALISEATRNNRLVPMTVERSELELCAQVLEENQTTRKEYTLPAPSESYQYASYFTVRYAPDMVDTKAVTKTKLKCVMCGKKRPKRCSKCSSVQYCSVVCQHAHWKAGHKDVCNKSSGDSGQPSATSSNPAGDADSVLIDSQQEGQYGTTFLTVTGVASHYKTGSIPHNVHGDSEFLVKIQICMMQGGPMMMYDETKSFTRSIEMNEPGAKELFKVVDQYGAMKLYMKPKREGKYFRIFLKSLPSQRQPW